MAPEGRIWLATAGSPGISAIALAFAEDAADVALCPACGLGRG